MLRYLKTASAVAVLAVSARAALADEPSKTTAASSAQSEIDGAFADAVAVAQKRTVKIFGAAIGRSPVSYTHLTLPTILRV